MSRIRIAVAADIPVNSVRLVTGDSHPPIALYRLADGFYATADLCSHGDASLSEGEIEDGEIVCPFHLGKFDIRTGLPTAAPCFAAIATFNVVMDSDGSVFLELP